MNIGIGKSKIDIIQKNAMKKVLLIAIPRLLLSSLLFIVYSDKNELRKNVLFITGAILSSFYIIDAIMTKNIYQLYFSFFFAFYVVVSIIINMAIGIAAKLIPLKIFYLVTEILNVLVLLSIIKEFNERYKWDYYKKIGANATIQSKCYKYLTNLRCF